MKEDIIFLRGPVLRTAEEVALTAGLGAPLWLDALGRSRIDRACRATKLQTRQTCCWEESRRMPVCPTCLARILLHLL